MSALRALNLEAFFVTKGWPFILLFFIYGAVFPPLAIALVIVGLISAERYTKKLRNEEIEEFDRMPNPPEGD